jgi:tetratricopeptide (TPR) repeat protein
MAQLTVKQAFGTAVQLHRAGRLPQARALYQQVLARQPNHADALHLLGVIAHQVGQNDVAVDLIGKAIAVKPDYPQAHCNLGNALRDMGRLDEAIAACRRAIALKPDLPEAHCNLGNAQQEKGQLGDAVAAYRQAIALKPDYPEAHSNLGASLRENQQLDEAIAACRKAIALRPGFAAAHSNLGIALHVNQQLEEAVDAYRQAIALQPNLPEAHYNLGTALRDQGLLDEAVAAYHQAISLKPKYAEAHYNLARVLLLRGEFLPGFKALEWRWLNKDFPDPRWKFAQPQWDGSDLTNQTIVLHAEQGFGDTIQFVRYVPLVAARGATVVFGCDPALRRLLKGTSGIGRWVDFGEALHPFDVHCPLMSLPAAFGTTLQTIPQDVPYLRAGPEAVERWRRELAGDGHPFRVGLVWAGRPTHQNDRNRSLSLANLAPLARATGVGFYSLQKGEAGKQATNPPAGMELIDRTEELNDFADTAALMANLDLVISVDTAVAHLAGAMGKPVWMLLPFVPDWRWLLGREDSPWYPTMRLFRQPTRGDWDSVIDEVARALSLRVEDGATRDDARMI